MRTPTATIRKAEQERDEAKKQAEALANARKEHPEKRAGILQRLVKTEGNWFADKERKSLYAQVREEDTEIEKLLENQTSGDLELEVKPE